MAPSTATHDYYTTLEVPRTASHDFIKASFRRLALLHHPDKNGGARSATIRTQLVSRAAQIMCEGLADKLGKINEAWETLGDSVKRRHYDNKTKPHADTSSGTHQKPAQSTPPPQQPKQPSEQEELRREAESQKRRKEWLDWEKRQEEAIRPCQARVKDLETDIAAFNEKIEENRKRLDNDIPYAWNIFAFLKPRLSENEKNELRRQNLNSEVAIRIKRILLDKERSRLSKLERELIRRHTQEEARLFEERHEKEKKARVEREKAKAEARRRHAAEQAKERAEREARDRARREAEARHWAARAKAAQEEALRQQAQRAREAAARQQQEETAAKARQEAQAREWARKASCGHCMWWEKIDGTFTCAHCQWPRLKYAFRCTGCQTIACIGCKKTLKAGGTPTRHSYAEDGNGYRRSKKKGSYARPASPEPYQYDMGDKDDTDYQDDYW